MRLCGTTEVVPFHGTTYASRSTHHRLQALRRRLYCGRRLDAAANCKKPAPEGRWARILESAQQFMSKTYVGEKRKDG
jgi:hypothetical protein